MTLRVGALARFAAFMPAVMLAAACTAGAARAAEAPATRAAPAAVARTIAIPGSSMSLGMRVTRVDSLVSFRGGRPGSPNRRSGLTRFFGLDASTTLDFDAGSMTHAHFEVSDVSTHSRDYVEDQLRRSGLKPMCGRRDDTGHECDWNGACLLHLSWAPGKLTADARPPDGWKPAEAAAAASVAAGPASAAAASVPAPSSTSAVAASSPAPPVAPVATPAGIAALTPTPPVVTTIGSSAAPPGAHPAAGGAGSGSTLAMLADTLFIGYPVDLSRAHRARTQVPPPNPVYPEAARSAGVQGVVRLIATVNARGMVSKTDIVHSIPELDRAAADATRGCRFVPLGPPGMPQGFQVVVQVRFTR